MSEQPTYTKPELVKQFLGFLAWDETPSALVIHSNNAKPKNKYRLGFFVNICWRMETMLSEKMVQNQKIITECEKFIKRVGILARQTSDAEQKLVTKEDVLEANRILNLLIEELSK